MSKYYEMFLIKILFLLNKITVRLYKYLGKRLIAQVVQVEDNLPVNFMKFKSEYGKYKDIVN